MKIIQLASAVMAIFVVEMQVYAQGTFVNLDFEAATLPDLPSGHFGGPVSASEALPGWNAYAEVVHNNLSLGGRAISIFGPNWDSSQILQGKYTVELYAGIDHIPTAIGQTGIIPATANSILFEASPGAIPTLQVTFDGHIIPLITENSHPTYDVLRGDLSGYAGESGELRFTTLTGTLLDRITFSSQVVPEPGIITLVGFGLGLIGLNIRRKR